MSNDLKKHTLESLASSSPAYFGKVFRQQTGMTPTQFRQRQG